MIIMIMFISMSLAGCGTQYKIATDIGGIIGASYQEAADKGAISAEQSIKAWPYVSGLIRKLLSKNYDLDMTVIGKYIMDDLDAMAAKETLTLEDKGGVIGSIVRLEVEGIKDGWGKYGISLFNLVVEGAGL
jgi:hypothetical protein